MNRAAATTWSEPSLVSQRTFARSEVLDLSHLRRFTAGNRALETEVLQLFANQAPLTLRAMQTAVGEKAWRDAAHTLKGSAGAIGAVKVARLATEAEAARAEPKAWPRLVSLLDAALAEVRAMIPVVTAGA